jgi:hypothetical protein
LRREPCDGAALEALGMEAMAEGVKVAGGTRAG